ncbi:MAG TPA: FAD-dependent oxidoreductase [Candidatus Thermoplasmatota archaeon]|nr:FAD-dependent oxidoreductase [Candidatus Thermoplasmatota archaeon]
MPPRPKVVVAGAGFAGLRVAQRLQDHADVTLVCPSERFVYLPLIHEVLSDHVGATEVTRLLEDVVPKVRHVRGRAAAVEGKELVTASGERFPFDALVVAIGAGVNDFGVPGVAENALSFYSVGDALRANAELKVAAAAAADRHEPVRVAVVGAGFTGVEVAGETAFLLDGLGVERQVTLLDALPDIFPRQSPAFREGIREGLKRLDLDLRTHQKIIRVDPDGPVVAKEGTEGEKIQADVTFWCAGIKPKNLPGVDPNVRPTLQSVARDDIYLCGDAARFPREMGVPALAQTAEQQAPIVAHNILHPEDKKSYAANVKGIIVSVGPKFAVAEIGGAGVFTGVVPWHIKRNLYKAKIALA